MNEDVNMSMVDSSIDALLRQPKQMALLTPEQLDRVGEGLHEAARSFYFIFHLTNSSCFRGSPRGVVCSFLVLCGINSIASHMHDHMARPV